MEILSCTHSGILNIISGTALRCVTRIVAKLKSNVPQAEYLNQLNITTVVLAIVISGQIHAQDAAIQTNLLYWATTTPNISLEIPLSNHLSLSTTIGYNYWNFPERIDANGNLANPKLHHWLVMPEVKYWRKAPFKGHFFGLHALGGKYNVGGLRFPKFLDGQRYDGWGAGGGISYGYNWLFGEKFGLEASLGIGYIYLNYKKFICGSCGDAKGHFKRNYFGPTKASLSFSYYFGTKTKIITRIDTVYIPMDKPAQARHTLESVAPLPVLEENVTLYEPLQEEKKMRSATATVRINYPVDDAAIRTDFNGNAAELQKIDDILSPIVSNPGNYHISAISIEGYASPEAPYNHNLSLSDRRAKAMSEFIIKKYGLSSDVPIHYKGKGEDWDGLRKAIYEDDGIEAKEQVLSIIDNFGIFNGREKRLMDLRGGRPYKYMMKNIFPSLRRMEMQIDYQVKNFDTEESRAILLQRPQDLSLREIFEVARASNSDETVATLRDKYGKEYEIAVAYFPNDDIANINASSAALIRGDLPLARVYLDRVKSNPLAANNLGVYFWLCGDIDTAIKYFEKALPTSPQEAQRNLRMIQDNN